VDLRPRVVSGLPRRLRRENGSSEHRFCNHVSFGIDNDLWLVRRDGSEAQRIWTSKDKHAALHPHFSEDGRRLIFAERVPTGKKIRASRSRGPMTSGPSCSSGSAAARRAR